VQSVTLADHNHNRQELQDSKALNIKVQFLDQLQVSGSTPVMPQLIDATCAPAAALNLELCLHML
jgi:hypothetical protein